MKLTNQKLNNEHVDDFSEIIPLFIYPNVEKSKGLYPDMDKAIEKCSEAIDRHSMFIKKEEFNRWIDDCYMTIGKARFYKHEYYLAIEVFEYLAKSFNLKPEKYDALVWLARTHMELNEMTKAEVYLKLIDEGKAIPDKNKSDYYGLYADFFIRKKQYDNAIEKLELAIKFTKKRNVKQRFNYVLAQIWLKKKEFAKATELFTAVIDLKPRYDMMFNAQISRALSFDVGGKNNDDVKKMLTKMKKDTKNKEFLDQIYYALADIAFKQNDEPLGIDYLKKSAWTSLNNQKQKALSYLRLGELYYSKPTYVPAQMYYDSSLTFLPETHTDYESVYLRAKALKNLVKNINIVLVEDSLQRMVLDEDYRKIAINHLIENEKLDEQRRVKLESTNIYAAGNSNPNGMGINATSNGKWYFYNSTLLGFGYNDFQKNWGNRKLEDNWRRSNKQTSISFDDDVLSEIIDSTIADSIVINEKTNPDYYLQFLPLDDNKMNKSHNNIIEALYALGNIYREDFFDYNMSIESFDELLNRYDTCRYVLPTWYNLYRISLTTNNDEMRAKYMRLIINNYPESEYARIIQDPSYNKATREGRKRVDNYYSILFDLYKEKKYDLVFTRVEKSRAIFAENHLQDKFDYLEAMSIGKINVLDSFKLALENLIKNHATSEVAEQARLILDNIKNGVGQKVDDTNTAKIKYNYRPNDAYTFVVIIPSNDVNTNKYKVDISDFNSMYYKNTPFNVNSLMLSGLNQIITVKELKDEAFAKDYYKSFKLNKELLEELNGLNYPFFIISNDNFVVFYKDKNIPEYLNFFNKQFGVE